jgi:predicted anti-sigma-YlaC factor YlaD
MSILPRPRLLALCLVAATPLLLGGCSVKRMAFTKLADTLAGSGTVFAADEDPELIRDAVPFSLKTMESLLAEVPEHRGLLLATCSGFTQYGYAFVQLDAEMLEPIDFPRAQEANVRARKMYLRGRDYCLRNLEVKYPGIRDGLMEAPAEAAARVGREDVPALYWTGASWGSAIALGLDRPELIADLPAVRALMARALALDEAWELGAIHGAMISVETATPDGGSPEKAREHYARAVALCGGRLASPHVSLATSVALPAQDRKEFEQLLNQALAVDPDKDPPNRLANLIAQKRARWLLTRLDALFLDGDTQARWHAPIDVTIVAGLSRR